MKEHRVSRGSAELGREPPPAPPALFANSPVGRRPASTGNAEAPDICPDEEIRSALDLSPTVPVILCDARLHEPAKHVLICLLEHIMAGAVPAHHG